MPVPEYDVGTSISLELPFGEFHPIKYLEMPGPKLILSNILFLDSSSFSPFSSSHSALYNLYHCTLVDNCYNSDQCAIQLSGIRSPSCLRCLLYVHAQRSVPSRLYAVDTIRHN